MSPSETTDEARDKVRDYLQAGTPLVWVVHPRSDAVMAHTPGGLAPTARGGDRLEHAVVLPSFACAVADLFG